MARGNIPWERLFTRLVRPVELLAEQSVRLDLDAHVAEGALVVRKLQQGPRGHDVHGDFVGVDAQWDPAWGLMRDGILHEAQLVVVAFQM